MTNTFANMFVYTITQQRLHTQKGSHPPPPSLRLHRHLPFTHNSIHWLLLIAHISILYILVEPAHGSSLSEKMFANHSRSSSLCTAAQWCQHMAARPQDCQRHTRFECMGHRTTASHQVSAEADTPGGADACVDRPLRGVGGRRLALLRLDAGGGRGDDGLGLVGRGRPAEDPPPPLGVVAAVSHTTGSMHDRQHIGEAGALG